MFWQKKGFAIFAYGVDL